MPRRPTPLTPEIVSPFPATPPWWLKLLNIVLAPVLLLLALAAALIGLVVVIVTVLGMTLWLAVSRWTGRRGSDVFEVEGVAARIDPHERIERTIDVAPFGQAAVRADRAVTVDVDLPAFARFDIRVPDDESEFRRPHVPGRYELVLCDDKSNPIDAGGIHSHLQWLVEHQYDVADEIPSTANETAWLGVDDSDSPSATIADRFYIASNRIIPGEHARIELYVEQTWDIEHLWYFEIANIDGDMYDIELTLM